MSVGVGSRQGETAMDRLQETQNGQSSDRDTLYILGGAALVLLGAGLLLSNQTVRKALGQVGVGDLLGAAVPDVERYLKLRSM
jgi:hypothetical protein